MTRKIYILILMLFIGLTNVSASNAYKNELLKVGFSPIGVSDVKVTLYTDKPYSEPLRLLRKTDSEFVLILPETYNSAPQKPSISEVIGDVTDVDVKLYSFASSSNENGYTKIVIRTNGSTNLYTEAVATGGGHSVNNEVNKIVASKITPTKYTPTNTPSTAYTNPQKTNTSPNPAINNLKDKNPVLKIKELVIPQKEPEKVKSVKPEQKVKLEQKAKSEVKVNAPEEVLKNTESATENTSVSEEINNNYEPDFYFGDDEASEETVTDESNSKQTQKNNGNKLFVSLLGFIKKASKAIFAIILSVLSLIFCISVLKSAKPKDYQKNEDGETAKSEIASAVENSGEYSSFFKSIIESEVKGENAFQLDAPSGEIKNDIKEPMSHKDVLNIDQNLSWQEKFRAIQSNKKALLNENEQENYSTSEISEDMRFENPIKKLKQEFKAVKKVLEKQNNKPFVVNPIEKKYQNEQAEKIEIISFEDYQKQVSPPKVNAMTSSPINSRAPKVLAQLPLADRKGLYLIDYNGRISLIGYINDKVFKLSSYNSLNKTKLYARLSESQNGVDTYIVKFDDVKMLVDVVDNQMKLKLTY